MPLIDLKQALSNNGFQVEAVILKALTRYIELLIEWNQHINLTAHRDLKDIIEKDIIDSFYLSHCIDIHRPNFESVIDLGCGAGFSGLVLALLHPNARVTFLDSSRKKINFVRQAARELHLSHCFFLNERAGEGQAASAQAYEVVISRATWQVMNFIKQGSYYVQNKGALFLMSGVSQEKPSQETLEHQGLETTTEFFYEIRPEAYQRKVFIFKQKHFT